MEKEFEVKIGLDTYILRDDWIYLNPTRSTRKCNGISVETLLGVIERHLQYDFNCGMIVSDFRESIHKDGLEVEFIDGSILKLTYELNLITKI